MTNRIDVADLAARLEIDRDRIEAMAAELRLPIVEARGGRSLRLRDAGRIVRELDPIDSPRSARSSPGSTKRIVMR